MAERIVVIALALLCVGMIGDLGEMAGAPRRAPCPRIAIRQVEQIRARVLFIIAAEIKCAFIINQTENYTVEPAKASKHVANEVIFSREKHHDIECHVRHLQSHIVTIGKETPGGSPESLRDARFDLETKLLANLTLENTMVSPGINLGGQSGLVFF